MGVLRGTHGFVDEDLDAVAHDLGRPQSHPFFRRGVSEEALPLSEDYRIYHQPELVQEIMLEQSLHESGTAVNHDGPVVLLAHASDILREITAEDCRVVPMRRPQRRRDDVLGHAVELVRELSLPRRPGGGESLVGLAAEEERVRLEGFVDLELVAFVPAIDLERPAGVLEFLASSRRFDDPIERYELGCNDPSHGTSSTNCWRPAHGSDEWGLPRSTKPGFIRLARGSLARLGGARIRS